jgi:plastocyanin
LGQQAYDPILSMADNDGRAWLTEHAHRAHTLVWFFYALAFVSLAGLLTPIKWPRLSIWFAIVVLVLGGVCLGAGGYISYAGGRIRHREFRNEPPPAATASENQPVAQPAGGVASAKAQITIEGLKYSPQTIEIRAGETVAWNNKDLAPHTVTSETGGELNSGSIEVDASWSHTFAQPGEFRYSCTYHPEMKGTITVK